VGVICRECLTVREQRALWAGGRRHSRLIAGRPLCKESYFLMGTSWGPAVTLEN
jgi:hypothetical protein